MKKLPLVAIASVLAAPAFADPITASPVGINASVSQGVNVGSVTNLGLNNVGVVNQNVGLGGGVTLNANAFNQGSAEFNMDTHAFSVGSIVDSGNGGAGGTVNVVAVSAAVALAGNEAEQGGLAGGLAVPVALAAQGTGVQTDPAGFLPVNAGVGVGANSATSAANVGTVQANLSLQNSASTAGSSQGTVGNGINANGGDGKAFMITVNSNNTSINNTSVSRIRVDTNINIADRGGVAGGLKVEDSFNPVAIEDSLNDNAVANRRTGIHRDVGVESALGPDLDTIANGAARPHGGTIPERDVLAENRACANGDVVPDANRRRNDGGRMNRARHSIRMVKQFRGARKRKTGMRRDQQWFDGLALRRKFSGNHRCGRTGESLLKIFQLSHKDQRTGSCGCRARRWPRSPPRTAAARRSLPARTRSPAPCRSPVYPGWGTRPAIAGCRPGAAVRWRAG